MINLPLSISEDNGVKIISIKDQRIYSVGISTGGFAEIRMAKLDSSVHVTATTIDKAGAEFARNHIEQAGLSHQIDVKIEDVSKTLPYSDGFFHFIYARLVLHYLSRSDLQNALKELYRILKIGGRMFVVVRSLECEQATDKTAVFDSCTGMTSYISDGINYIRHFHSEDSIRNFLLATGFNIKYLRTYKERLCVDFERTQPAKQVDTLIEVLSTRA